MAKALTPAISRKTLYAAMLIMLVAIFIGASRGAAPVYLAVGFIGEIIMVATVHLSSVLHDAMATQREA